MVELPFDYSPKKAVPRWLPKVLRQWHEQIETYCRVVEEDVPYYYNERANVGLLAGAAWVAGGLALEEYCTVKGAGRNGRCDLYLRDLRSRKDLAAEAKQLFVNTRLTPARVALARDSALEAASQVTHQALHTAGIVFFVPKLTARVIDRDPAGAHQAVTDRCRDALDIIKTGGFDLLAWSFPESRRKFRTEISNGRKYYFPGVVLAMKMR